MICRLSGKIIGVTELAALVELGGLCYEVLAPAAALPDLARLVGNEVTLHTIQYLEGSLGGGNLTPRLIGFLAESDREFFVALTRVKGISTRKALRAMSVPPHVIAAAIEHGDERSLTGLPEIGRKTAAQMITELRGQLAAFLAPAAKTMPVAELSGPQMVALEILVQWGDRRADAQRWISAAVEGEPGLTEPDAIVRAAYRVKQGAAR